MLVNGTKLKIEKWISKHPLKPYKNRQKKKIGCIYSIPQKNDV